MARLLRSAFGQRDLGGLYVLAGEDAFAAVIAPLARLFQVMLCPR
ncbi:MULTISPECIES: hypothetical protein [unclassified Microbulbifer]|nr:MULTISPECIES: hypothetical protein [unclassified Microbulbifer]